MYTKLYFTVNCQVSTTLIIIHSICMYVGTCESFFSFESNIESAVRFVFESNLRIESAGAQTTVVYTLHLQRIFNPLVFCICDERE